MLISNGTVLTDNGFSKTLSVRVTGDKVSEIGEALQPAAGETVLNLDGDTLLPGFVDVHIHGFQGHDVMDGEEAVRSISRDLGRIGVAAFCPTTISASCEDTARAVEAIRRVMRQPEKNGAAILGVHMEAPFLNENKAGAQQSRYFRDPDPDRLIRMAGDLADIRLITMAPERPGSEKLVKAAVAAGIHVSIGHTEADAELLHRTGDWGADHITHLFNAQPPLHHRKPGVPGAALTDDRFYCEMICDGQHLHQDIVKMIIRCKGKDRTVVITDAMEAAGMPDGAYQLGGQQVQVRDHAARLGDGTLAGSVLTMPEALNRLIHVYGVEPYTACAVCTSTPAESVGETLAGHMREGSPAILTRWTPDWRMKSVITAGTEICHTGCRML